MYLKADVTAVVFLSSKDVSTDGCGRGPSHSQLPEQPSLQQHYCPASILPSQYPQSDNTTPASTTNTATNTSDNDTNARAQRSVDSRNNGGVESRCHGS